MVMLTDNEPLLKNYVELPALVCAQQKADKCIPKDEDFINSNIASFGNDIGRITNHATSMYEIRSRFEVGSKEYETLDYRIKTAEKYQQDEI